MLIDLKGKVTIVTGAGRGIGHEIAKTFAAEGAIVVITDVRQDLLDQAAAEWKDNGWQGLQRPLRRHVERTSCRPSPPRWRRQFGRIDVLVNNAGVATGGKVEELAEDIWDKNFDINTKGTFLMCQAVIPAMKRQKSGRIINAASFAAIIPSHRQRRLCRLARRPWSTSPASSPASSAPATSRSTAYAPGMIPTEMNHFAEAAPERQETLLNTLIAPPLGRSARTSRTSSASSPPTRRATSPAR